MICNIGFNAEFAEGAEKKLRLEEEGDCDRDAGGDGLAVLAGRFVAVLLEGVHGGFVK
jgi:hypothetical protein